MRRSPVAALIIIAVSVSIAFAQTTPPADLNRAQSPKWSVEDVIMAEQAGGLQISPDGRWAVWVKNVADKEKDGRISNLVLSSLTEKREIELTGRRKQINRSGSTASNAFDTGPSEPSQQAEARARKERARQATARSRSYGSSILSAASPGP